MVFIGASQTFHADSDSIGLVGPGWGSNKLSDDADAVMGSAILSVNLAGHVPRYLVQHYTGCFCEGIFKMRLILKSVDFE